ncbi:histidine-type phosphatase [Caulobacter sp. BP25]|uniref:histidine-type phosphatase n=1 Tax=Caulobacter sp. BP25 TaxID=2048900 RepID=UPI000C12A3FD|nr:histidine-type phosphatase [Caulobacter sp. BP25]PHY21736.1 histidine-type phosphatase [Caulobacter sp. BP25]
MSSPRTSHRLALSLLACAVLGWAGVCEARAPRVEHVVVVMRHGVRAPIVGEAPEGTLTRDPWPTWPAPAEHLTPRGARAMERLGRSDRSWFAKLGVLPTRGCPMPGQVTIWTNTAQRTIASGEAFAQGLAPGCGLVVGHRAAGDIDPLFEPLRAGVAPFDPAAAIASIEAYTGGVDRLADRLKPQLDELDRVLGCGAPQGCQPASTSGLKASADGRGVDLSGPIRDASGTAQVLLLQYVEGLSPAPSSWRGIDPAALKRLGALHAALFDVFTRPPYMTARQAGPLGRRVLETLENGPRVDVLVGHDTNVTALAAALGVPLDAPGYATGDTPPGGALVLMSLVDEAGRRTVRVYYRTQSPEALRRLSGDVTRQETALPSSVGPVSLERFREDLTAKLQTSAPVAN